MGGVTQAVESAAKKGIVTPVTKVAQAAGVVDKPRAPAPAAAAAAEAPVAAAAKSAAAEKKDEVAATLRARRRGARALLSESRLNPETGLNSTLGSGPMV